MRAAPADERSLLNRGGGALIAVLFAAVVGFAVLPVGRLLLAAFLPGGVFGLSGFTEQIMSRAAQRAMFASFESATASSVLALGVGGILALVLAATDVRGRQLLTFLFVLSMLISPQVAAVAFLSLTGSASPILNTLGLAPEPGSVNPLLGRNGVVLVMGLHHAPLVLVVLIAGFKRIPRGLVDAARIDGASPWRIVTTILLPLLRPHLVGAALLAFVAGIGNFGIPAVLGLPVNYVTLPTLIYRRLSSFGPTIIGDIAALGVLVGAMAGLGVIASRMALRAPAVLIEDETRLEPFWRLGRSRPFVESVLWLVTLLVLVLPGLGLLAAALVPSHGMPLTASTITLEHFAEVLLRQQVTVRAFTNSLTFAGGSALFLACLSIPLAYALARRTPRIVGIVSGVIEMPYALPGIVLAVACILLFLRPLPLIGQSLYATPWIILFGYAARFLPVVLKPVLAAMGQVDPAQEEAAALDGAGSWRRLRDIVAPSLFPAAAAGALLAFLFAFGELTVSALLWSAGTETVGVILYSFEEAGLASQAAAIGLVTITVVAMTMIVLDTARSFLPEGILPWRV
ncbi:ABC transporter permease [Microvirga rosea]|uniref:ABC transporter permease n=1 Tax=Microvirga rosea TaxID=2715425 RepID=UPI001D09C83D|nr:iron ABC transporter permease [Microvirga rosea]MCB8820366.1 iron ABC transporter permease [Microvirga rosea]